MSTTTTVILRLGDNGGQVSQLQTLLQSAGYYNGAIDGNFGPQSQQSVMNFQQDQGLTADGVAGPQTWAALSGGSTARPTPTHAVINAPANSTSLSFRCLALTGSFETSKRQPDCFAAIAGDFDGQGMSYGCLQWNWGQQTLQPLLQQLDQEDSNIIDQNFGVNAATLRQVLTELLSQQLAWVRSIQDSGHHIQQPWHDQFASLGYTDEFQQIEVAAAQQRFSSAQNWCGTYGVSTERAVALMFDINVQNGSISQATQQLIMQDFQGLQPTGDAGQDEVNKLVIIANRRADASNPAAQADVRSRKLCIANGQGTVHGVTYDIENDFGITLNAAL